MIKWKGNLAFSCAQKVEIRNVRKGGEIFSINAAGNNYAVTFVSPHYLVVSNDTLVRVFNLKKKNHELVHSFTFPQFTWDVDSIPGRRPMFVGGCSSRQVTGFDLKKELFKYTENTTTIRATRVLRTRNWVCSGCTGGSVVFYDYPKQKVAEKTNITGQIYSMVEDRKKKVIIAGNYNQYSATIIDLRGKKRNTNPSTARETQMVWGVGVVEGSQIYTSGNQGTVTIYDYRKLTQAFSSYKFHTSTIYRLVRIGNTMFSCGADGLVVGVDIRRKYKTKKKIWEVRSPNAVYGLAHLQARGKFGRASLGGEDDCSWEDPGEAKSVVKKMEEMERAERLGYLLDQYHEEYSPFELKLANKNIRFLKCLLLSPKFQPEGGREKKQAQITQSPPHKVEEEMITVKEEMEEVGVCGSFDVDESIILKIIFEPKYRILRDEQRFNQMLLLDYFSFFRHLGMKSEMMYILREIQSIKDLDLLIVLFMKSVQKLENLKVKDLFFRKKEKGLVNQLQKYILEDTTSTSNDNKEEQKKKRKKRKKRVDGDDNVLYEFDSLICLFLAKLFVHRDEEIKESPTMLRHFHNIMDPLRKLMKDMKTTSVLEHKDLDLDWKATKKRYSVLFKDDDEEEEEEEERKEEEDEHKIDVMFEEDFFSNYGKILKSLTLEELFVSKKFWNVRLKTKDGTSFRTHKEILISKSPFFYRMIKFSGAEVEKMKETGCIELEYLNKYEVELLLHYYYTGILPLSTVIEEDVHVYIPALFRLCNHAEMFVDHSLRKEIFRCFKKYFRGLEKSVVKSLITNNGYILESDKLQKDFVELVVDESDDCFDGEEEVNRIMQNSKEKFKMEIKVTQLRKKNQKIKKENNLLMLENRKIMEKIEMLSAKE